MNPSPHSPIPVADALSHLSLGHVVDASSPGAPEGVTSPNEDSPAPSPSELLAKLKASPITLTEYLAAKRAQGGRRVSQSSKGRRRGTPGAFGGRTRAARKTADGASSKS